MKTFFLKTLKFFLRVHNLIYKIISFLSIKVEGGIHPKHRIMNYHDFFVSDISDSDTVLDIGCGNGALSFDIAKKAKSVIGIDINKQNIEKAQSKYGGSNIKYLVGDATKDLKGEKFDVIVLSNVLEHIENRTDFLKNIKNLASKFLIRVPVFDRDWMTLYKKEFGIEWRLDKTHFIEYTEVSFREEMKKAGYQIENLSIQFGEIWSIIRGKE
jgi:SAM-dependent methyltransferase